MGGIFSRDMSVKTIFSDQWEDSVRQRLPIHGGILKGSTLIDRLAAPLILVERIADEHQSEWKYPRMGCTYHTSFSLNYVTHPYNFGKRLISGIRKLVETGPNKCRLNDNDYTFN